MTTANNIERLKILGRDAGYDVSAMINIMLENFKHQERAPDDVSYMYRPFLAPFTPLGTITKAVMMVAIHQLNQWRSQLHAGVEHKGHLHNLMKVFFTEALHMIARIDQNDGTNVWIHDEATSGEIAENTYLLPAGLEAWANRIFMKAVAERSQGASLERALLNRNGEFISSHLDPNVGRMLLALEPEEVEEEDRVYPAFFNIAEDVTGLEYTRMMTCTWISPEDSAVSHAAGLPGGRLPILAKAADVLQVADMLPQEGTHFHMAQFLRANRMKIDKEMLQQLFEACEERIVK